MTKIKLVSFIFVIFSVLFLVGSVSAFQITGNVVSVSSSGTATISGSSQTCSAPTCEGRIDTGKVDANGCTIYSCPTTTCPVGCTCDEETTTCPTSQEKPIEVEVSTSSGSSTKVSIGKSSENSISIKEGVFSVETSEGVVIKDKKIFMDSSQGEQEIKVMPSTASEVAINQLKLKDYSIELKNTGKPVYEITGKSDVKVLGFIQAEMTLKSQVSSETGEVEKIEKPWWAFLAKE